MFAVLMDSIIRRQKSVFCTVLLCMVSVVLIYFAVYIYKDNIYCIETVETLLSGGTAHTGLLNCTNSSIGQNKTFDNFRKELCQLDEIEGIGSPHEPSVGYSNVHEILNVQKKQMSREEIDSYPEPWEGDMYCINLENTYSNSLNLKLDSGELLSDINQPDDVTYLYLGYNLREIPIGTEYEVSAGNNQTYKLVVKGILEKGSRVINRRMLMNTKGFYSEFCFFQLDNLVVAVSNESLSSALFFQYKNGAEFETVREKIEAVAEKYGYDLMIGHTADIVEEKKETTRELNKTILDLLVIALFVCISIMICMQIMLIINNKAEYGILCANGFNVGSICGMLVIENVMKMVIAYLGGTWIAGKVIFYAFARITEMQPVYQDIFWGSSIYIVALCSLGIVIVSSIVPVVMMSKYKVVDLIGGNET